MTKIILFITMIISGIAFADTKIIEIDIKDHKFNPERIVVPSGERIKLVVKNKDSTIEEFESSDLNREKIIPPGGKANIILAPLKVGEYKFEGEFHPDTAQGVLIVE